MIKGAKKRTVEAFMVTVGSYIDIGGRTYRVTDVSRLSDNKVRVSTLDWLNAFFPVALELPSDTKLTIYGYDSR